MSTFTQKSSTSRFRIFITGMTDSWFGAPANRHLTYTKTVAASPATTFNALADVSSYERATSLIYASSVTSKDNNGLPKSAKLNVGYPALSLNEAWVCHVKCDRQKKTIEITSPPAGGFSNMVESYVCKWSVSPVASEKGRASMKLDLDIKFKGPMVDSMFSVLPDVALSMSDRFEALVVALDKKEKEQAKQKPPAAPVKKPIPAKKAEVPAATPAKRAPKKLEVRSADGKQQTSS